MKELFGASCIVTHVKAQRFRWFGRGTNNRKICQKNLEQKANRKDKKGKAAKTMDGKGTRRYESSGNKRLTGGSMRQKTVEKYSPQHVKNIVNELIGIFLP